MKRGKNLINGNIPILLAKKAKALVLAPCARSFNYFYALNKYLFNEC